MSERLVAVDTECSTGETFTTWEPVDGPAPEPEWFDAAPAPEDAPPVDYAEVRWGQGHERRVRGRLDQMRRYYGSQYQVMRRTRDLAAAERYTAAVAAGDDAPECW